MTDKKTIEPVIDAHLQMKWGLALLGKERANEYLEWRSKKSAYLTSPTFSQPPQSSPPTIKIIRNTPDKKIPIYDLLLMTKAYNQREMAFEEWARQSKEWIETIIDQYGNQNP